MATLYRKYRPQKFSDITGQEHIVATIQNEIAAGKTAHAYLFSGPRGVGKTTIARILAKAINCERRAKGSYEPCDECSSCTEIAAGRNIDVIEIDAASHTGVDNVRENIIENAQFKPTKSKYKVFIIDEVHMLSTSAFNALLKTIEEPPAHVIFVLATTEAHKILPTIVSRCQRFGFQKIPYEQMLKRLTAMCAAENVKVDKDVLERVVNKSDGCLRDAESLLGQIMSLNLKKISAEDAALILPASDVQSVLSYAEALAVGNDGAAITVIARLVNDGVNLEQFALDLIEVWRTAMLAQSGQTVTADYSPEALKRVKKLSGAISPALLIRLIDRTLARKQEIRTAPVPQLPLELLAVEFGGGANSGGSDQQAGATDVNALASTLATNKTSTSSESVTSASTPDESTKRTLTNSIKSAISSLSGKHDIKATLADVEQKWPEMIKKLDTTNHSLTFILKMCAPMGIEGENLLVTVPYSFHKEKLDDKKTKKLIETCLSELLGEKISLLCDVNTEADGQEETMGKRTEENNNVDISTLATEFGGEVVNK